MDPGEQTTGTRDEHYDLISVLYHALHGAENCNTYALDAEAAGKDELAAFFREAGVVQARLAERAKKMLGILEVPPEPEVRPEGAVPSGIAPEDVPPRSANVRAGEIPPPIEEAPPTADVSPTPAGTSRPLDEDTGPPSSGAARDPDLVFPDEDVVMSEEASPEAPQAEVARITREDFDPTISALEGGIARLAIGRALAEIETWERKLEASGDPELESIAENLGALRALLTADNIDAVAAGPLLTTLGEQVERVASSGTGALIADKLQRLSELLTNEGRSLSG